MNSNKSKNEIGFKMKTNGKKEMDIEQDRLSSSRDWNRFCAKRDTIVLVGPFHRMTRGTLVTPSSKEGHSLASGFALSPA